VLGLSGLYNFIRVKEGVELEEIYELDTPGNTTPLLTLSKTAATKAIETLRDKIAKDMWIDYCEYIKREL
jgi:hypothetical protein